MTPFSEFYTPVRVMLGDTDPMDRMYDDAMLSDVLLTIGRMGRAVDGMYSVTSGGSPLVPGFTPDVTRTADFGLIAVEAALMVLTPQETGVRYQTRALSATSDGRAKADLLRRLQQMLYEYQQDAGGATADLNGHLASRQSFEVFLRQYVPGTLSGLSVDVVAPTPYDVVRL